MNVFLRAAAVVLLVALGFLAGRLTPTPKRALDAFFAHTQKRALDALAAVRDAPRGLVSAELPPEGGSENFAAQVDRMPVGAIDPSSIAPAGVALAPPAPSLPPPELSRFVSAAALYRKGDRAGADPLAAQISDPFQRAALEWVALKSAPDRDHLTAFEGAHKDWPAADWMRDMQEGWLYSERTPAATIEALFAHDPPRTPAGVLAAARAEVDGGHKDKATSLVRGLWRDLDLDYATEGKVLREFGVLLTRADHKYRADRLLYAEKIAPALRAAGLAGADEVALADARIEAMRGPLSPRAIASVPASLQSDPGLIFARVQDARRGNRTAEAAAWLALAPHDSAALIDPDKWWTERRMVAREWLDRGAFKQAYELCAGAPTASVPAHVDAAFHAGWIALRFLNDAPAAAKHFAEASAVALTPLAHARSDYWQGRAAEALDKGEDARRFYERAAGYPIAYYGQLAARKLGRDGDISPRTPHLVATGEARAEATRIIELYYDAGLDDFAASLAFSAARNWSDESQIAALGKLLARRGDARTNVTFGKLATERGFAIDETAFPTFGLPSFSPLPHSADIASVMAVARQESEFSWRAASGAGAKGLMQILPATAEMTARRAGVPFDFGRLIGDPAFNLQLGAAYLGQLIDDEGGSVEMALAAYNAGAGRVAQWIAAYGDPRSGAVDPVDWVERIPYDETRDYVERVSENLGIYRARLNAPEAGQPGRVARE
jgi:soluble lytic murein transglycosylase